LIDVQKEKSTKEIREHDDKILRLSVSSDGRHLASLGQDRLIIWDCSTWKPIHTVEGPFPTSTYLPLAFGRTAPMLATASATDPTIVQIVHFQ
jgi:WD40 repeat protein